MKQQHAGSDWIRDSLKITNMSPLGIAVADLLGDLYLGIYHINSNALRKVNWADDWCIEITIIGSMSTYDDDLLTRLVVLSHDRMIRVQLDGTAYNYLRLMFHRRKSREGAMFQRMPELETHIEIIRNHYSMENE